MAGANNKALAKAGMHALEIRTMRASPSPHPAGTANSIALTHSAERRAGARNFRAGAAAFLKGRAADKAAAALPGKERRADLTSRGLRAASGAMLAKRKAAAAAAKPDPHADKRARIDRLEQQQELGKRINKVINAEKRRGGDDWQQRAASRLLSEKVLTRPDLAQKLVKPDFAGRHGVPDYMFTNNGATIRRLKDQIGMERTRGKKWSERTIHPPQQDPKFWAEMLGR